MANSARSWDNMFHSYVGLPTRTHVSACEKSGLVFIHTVFVLPYASFLFRKLLGVGTAGKKRRCSFDVPYDLFHRSQTAGPGYGDIPEWTPTSAPWLCGHMHGHGGGMLWGNPFQSRPRVTWVVRRQPLAASETFLLKSLMDKRLHVSPEPPSA